MALTKVIGSGIGTVTDNLVITSDDPTITMTDSSGTNDIVTLQSTSGALIVTARDGSSDGEIIFKKTDGSATDETMRINSSGAVLINNTARNDLGVVEILTTIGTDNAMIIKTAESGASGSATAMKFRFNSSTTGSIGYSSSGTSFNTSSDYRLKENVNYTFDATTRLKQLKPCRFNWIIDDTDTAVDGFLAHEVSSVVPEAISGDKDATDDDGNIIPQGIDQSKLVPLLVKTIQELEARITALENE